MTKMNRCEAEIDAIRLKLYEETKDLTPEEHTRRSNELGEKLAAQYGFTICPSAPARTTTYKEKRTSNKPEIPLTERI